MDVFKYTKVLRSQTNTLQKTIAISSCKTHFAFLTICHVGNISNLVDLMRQTAPINVTILGTVYLAPPILYGSGRAKMHHPVGSFTLAQQH